jgi:aldehyde dehydrogenase (NAD+)
MENILNKQREFFKSGATLPIKTRLEYLKKLKTVIKSKENEIFEAIKKDLGKSATEAYMCEVGLSLDEISYFQKNLKKFAKDKTVFTPLTNFHSRSYIKSVPWGNVLIISPWNYPFLLSIEPLVDAIAAGNTVVLKPSAYSPFTSEIVSSSPDLIPKCSSWKSIRLLLYKLPIPPVAKSTLKAVSTSFPLSTT